eukprot:381698-Hanusia_phi.AAC.1
MRAKQFDPRWQEEDGRRTMSLRARALLLMLLCFLLGVSTIFRSMWTRRRAPTRSSVKLRMHKRLQRQLALLNSSDISNRTSSSSSNMHTKLYTVKPNDRLHELATKFAVPLAALVEANGIADADRILVHANDSDAPDMLAGRTGATNPKRGDGDAAAIFAEAAHMQLDEESLLRGAGAATRLDADQGGKQAIKLLLLAARISRARQAAHWRDLAESGRGARYWIDQSKSRSGRSAMKLQSLSDVGEEGDEQEAKGWTRIMRSSRRSYKGNR